MRRKLECMNLLVIVLAILFVAAGGIHSVYKMSQARRSGGDGEVRLMCSEAIYELEQGEKVESPYPYVVTDLTGQVIESTNSDCLVGWEININEVLSKNQAELEEGKETPTCFTLEKDHTVNGFVIFYVPVSGVVKEVEVSAKKAWIPLLLGVSASILLLIFYGVYARRNIYKPVREISKSANAIIAGNYEIEVVRVYGEEVRSNEVGELIYSFELMRDELKEKQIREAELTMANKELISCISHDLRTPLATIKAYAEGLRDGIARTKEQQAQYVGVILNKTNLLVTMIKELLEYSNAQASRMEIDKKEVYLHEYLVPVVEEIRGLVEKKGITFASEILKEDALIRIDERRITEVLFNLIENSMKYMDKKEGVIKLIVEKKGQNLRFRVIDNGMGISAEDILYVFDKFYRAEKSRTSSVPGSGLGLSICQYIIKEHGGEILCKSHVGEGCEIIFTIPLY